MNKNSLLQIALFSGVFSFAQNIDTTKYQKVTPRDTIKNYYPPQNYTGSSDTVKNYYSPNIQSPDSSQNQPQKQDQSGNSNSNQNKNNRYNRNNKVNPRQQPPSNELMDKLYFGAYLALSGYGNIIYYELSPHVGYKITEQFSMGLQILYNNTALIGGGQSGSYSVYGGGAFARFLLPEIPMFNVQFFPQAEYDILAVPSNYLGNATIQRAASEEKMLGMGIRRSYGKVSAYILFMYDINASYYSPYYSSPLLYRFGFSYNW